MLSKAARQAAIAARQNCGYRSQPCRAAQKDNAGEGSLLWGPVWSDETPKTRL